MLAFLILRNLLGSTVATNWECVKTLPEDLVL